MAHWHVFNGLWTTLEGSWHRGVKYQALATQAYFLGI